MSEERTNATQVQRHDLVTVAAVGVVAYALTNILHEGLGHGGACLLVGGRPRILSSLHFDGDTTGLAPWALRLIGAAGTLVNVVVGAVILACLPALRSASPQFRYFAWLVAVVNLFQGTGYLLFSGVAGIGDWASVIDGFSPSWLWRATLAVVGGVSYFLVMRVAMIRLGPFIGGERRSRYRRALALSVIPYVAGSALYIVSGLFNPAGTALVVASAVASSVGGTCGFLWAPQLLLGEGIPPTSDPFTPIVRNWGWIGGAGVVMLLFIGVLGPSVRLS
jgi:hypothetical protein